VFAVDFDMDVASLRKHYPRRVPQAYEDISKAPSGLGFKWVQGSVYVSRSGDLADLPRAVDALRSLPWFGLCVRDIRAFKVENWSDFTPLFKSS
jgi:virulence-associated protein VapD